MSISADPADINVLPGYSNDPRTVDKLVDGHNRTCDDTHMWLAPFTPGQHHRVTLDFGARQTLGVLRVWNYNKSRIHASRGARLVSIRLDESLVFAGEIGRAPGCVAGAEGLAEVVLWTMQERVLGKIERRDAVDPNLMPIDETAVLDTDLAQRAPLPPRPRTAGPRVAR